MKKVFHFFLMLLVVVNLFSCSHKQYPQKSNRHTQSSTVKEPYFLFISDIHLDINLKNTDSLSDTGLDLWKAFTLKIDSILGGVKPPSFVLCTGDLPAHYICDTSCALTGSKLEKHNRELQWVFSSLRDLVNKHHLPLFYVPGNNDALTGDYFSFANKDQQTSFSLVPESQNPYPAVNTSATGSVAPCMLSMPTNSMGYYAALALPGLRIIALNSVIFSKKYEAVDGVTQLDAGNTEMEWLSNQLQESKEKGEKVYIAMHIPPGIDAYKSSYHKKPKYTWAQLPSRQNSWEKSFLLLAENYQTTIAGIFYGHTHMDEFRLLYDSTGKYITEVALSSPGITPLHGNNPGFKTVSFNSVTKAPDDFTTFYTTLPISTVWGSCSYSFSSIFNKKQGVSIVDFIRSQSEQTILQGANKIYTVMHGLPKYAIGSGMIVKY